jgi:hypothetical protein
VLHFATVYSSLVIGRFPPSHHAGPPENGSILAELSVLLPSKPALITMEVAFREAPGG